MDMVEKKVTIRYELGHSYDFTYRQTELYCPECGSQSVWVEQGDRDFYEGPDYACTNCDSSFTLPSLGKAEEQLIKQLKG